MPDSVTIIDNRTGERYELPVMYGTYPTYGAAIPAATLRTIKQSEDDFGLMTYDPGYTNTAVLQELDHVHRRRAGDSPLLRLPDRGSGREPLVPGGRLSLAGG